MAYQAGIAYLAARGMMQITVQTKVSEADAVGRTYRQGTDNGPSQAVDEAHGRVERSNCGLEGIATFHRNSRERGPRYLNPGRGGARRQRPGA